MKQFNKTGALRKIKLKQNKNTYIKRLSISLSCLILLFVVILFTFARFETSSDEYNLINGIVKYSICDYEVGHSWDFDYTGTEQEFNVPCNGEYKIELWGAFNGSYTSGNIELKQSDDLYVYVGQTGQGCNPYTQCSGYSYNGGGAGDYFSYPAANYYSRGTGGGGATDIRYFEGNNKPTSTDLEWNSTSGLRSRIMVAAGGTNKLGGGGLTGYSGQCGGINGTGGTQISGGTASSPATSGGFGYGGNGYVTLKNAPNNNHGYGGASGYYGGGGGKSVTSSGTYDVSGCSGSGSSYISGHTGCIGITSASDQSPKNGCSSGTSDNNCSKHYSGAYFTDTKMIDGAGYNWTNVKGSQEQMPNPLGGNYASGTGHSGNGYAKIILLSTTDTIKVNYDNLLGETWTYNYTGNTQSFSAPCNGTYKVELWGASGGSNRSSDPPGLGGYVSGNINISTDDIFYIQVGNQGDTAMGGASTPSYNGGGTTGYYSSLYEGYGGGATDIRMVSGAWNNEDSLRSRIMVAAGGGGGGGNYSYYLRGGHAGGLTGNSGTCGGSCSYSPVTGGSQTSGGYNSQNSLSGSFGVSSLTTTSSGYSGGGGSGWYAGVKGYGTGGSGGSSYISGHTGCVAVTSKTNTTPKNGCSAGTTNKSCSISPYEYEFTNTKIIDGAGYNWTNVKGSQEQMPNPLGGYYASGAGHSGNGLAKITYVSK